MGPDNTHNTGAMYETFYRLRADPFGLSPDPGLRVPHPGFRRARAELRQALSLRRGLIVLLGPAGVGKTVLIEEVLAASASRALRPVQLSAPAVGGDQLLPTIACRLGVPAAPGHDAALPLIEGALVQAYRRGRRTLLVVDDAHALGVEALQALCTLAASRHDERFLLQIVLSAQAPLEERLAEAHRAGCRAPVVARCHLAPLSLQATRSYLEHRLRQAGWEGGAILSGEAIALLHRFSQGCPRYLNIAAARALHHGAHRGLHTLDAAVVAEAVRELEGDGIGPGPCAPIEAAADPAPAARTARPQSQRGNTRVAPYPTALAALGLLAVALGYAALAPHGPHDTATPRPVAIATEPPAPLLPPALLRATALGTAAALPLHPAEEQLQALLARAEAALVADRLTTPAEDSAHLHYRQALALDPGNGAAQRGLERVVERYLVLARAALARGEYRRAQRLLQRGQAVLPQHRGLEALQADVAVLRARRERQAAASPSASESVRPPVAAPAPPDPPPPPSPPGLLQRLRIWLTTPPAVEDPMPAP